jgi:transposase
VYHWKRQYAKGTYDNEPTQEAALEERVRQLEQMLGKVILENEFLKKAVRKRLAEAEQDARLSRRTGTSSPTSKGGATS